MSEKATSGGENEVAAEVVTATAPWDMPEAEDNDLIPTGEVGLSVGNMSEVDAQISVAHKYPRSITKFMRRAISIATRTVPIAESCIYALPRGGKPIVGPSIRLAEIVAGAYGNLHAAARVLDAGDVSVTSQGVAWDLETNTRITTETQRRITNKKGERFNDDMILMTGNAAASIALRNAIFRVVPRAYVDEVFERVRLTAVGKASTMIARRDEVLSRLAKMGATIDRVLPALGLQEVGDITLDHMEILIGSGTAIKNGDKTVDEVFPAVQSQGGPAAPAVEQGRRVSIRSKAGRSEGPATGAASTEPPRAAAGALPTREALEELDGLVFHTKTPAEAVAGWFGKTATAQLTASEVTDAIGRLSHVDNGGRLDVKGNIVHQASEPAKAEDPKPDEVKREADQPKFSGGK